MKQEEKRLLTIAISGYYPYGLICKVGRYKRQILEVGDGCVTINDSTPSDKHFHLTSYGFDEWTVKPYLRSMSTMTDEERKEYYKLNFTDFSYERVDWLNKHKFDYRGLIALGLALEATENMYK